MFEDSTQEELRLSIARFLNPPQAVAPAPLPPGVSASAPAEQRDVAATLYGQSIMQKRAEDVTKTERDFLAASIAACLKDMGR